MTARQGLNELTIRREGSSRERAPEQDQAYLLLCAAADRLRNHDLAAVQAMHAQACALDAIQDGVPVAVTAAYELLETILRNEIVDAEGQCTAEIRTRFPTPGVKATPRTVVGWDSTSVVVDAAVTGGVMAAAMIQDVLAMAGMGPFPHR